MKTSLCGFLLLFIGFQLQAQQPDTVFLSKAFNLQKIDSSATYTWQKKDIPFTQIRSVNTQWQRYFSETFIPQKSSLWLHFFIQNDMPGNTEFFLRDWREDQVNYYILRKNKVFSKQAGVLAPHSRLDDLEAIDFFTFPIDYKETVEVYVQLAHVKGWLDGLRLLDLKPISPNLVIGSEKKLDAILRLYFIQNIKEVQVRNLYQGALMLLAFISLFFLIKLPNESVYRYYFFYVLAGLGYSLVQSRGYTFIGQGFQSFPYIKKFGGELVFWLGLSAYFHFVSSLLEFEKKAPKLYALLQKISLGLFIFGTLQFLYLCLTNDNSYLKFMVYNKIPVILFYIGLLIHIRFKFRGILSKYIVFGNILLVIFGTLAWLKATFLNHFHWPGILDYLITLPFAVLLEITVFTFALAVRQKIESYKKLAFERQILETEMLALRSQMNPHFVFNSLSSIRNLIMKNENEKAIAYISRFSKLVRNILQQTQKKVIGLDEELETLKLYIQSEADRLDESIQFELEIDRRINLEEFQFPPMILQPVVENAIWHGLQMSKKASKQIKITFSQLSERSIQISVEDNGIGRRQSELLKSKTGTAKVSLSAEITKKRLALFNANAEAQLEMKIIDLPNQEGTKVIFNYQF